MSGRLLLVACFFAALAGLLSPAGAVTSTTVHGLHPMADDKPVPAKWLPPGANDPDPGPSSVIYPPQKITIRFNHTLHIKENGANCQTCHGKAKSSKIASDRLLPDGTTCDTCHDTDHSDLKAVKPGSEEMGQCQFCHLGYRESAPNKVAKLELPAPNMVFNHKAHLDRNINCAQCHGSVEEMELATRDQLPRMKGCFGCHNQAGPAQGQAKSDCATCHTRESSGQMQTLFATGELKPPRWMSNSQHTADFLERHKRVAADNSKLCASCHAENFCTDCHDGRIKPRSIHPNDFISMHPVAARQDGPKCASCHQQQSFCLTCHQRLGVAMSGPNVQGNQFHPPGFGAVGGRGPGHHSWEAQRNLNACVSCHTERDCATCHADTARGGMSVNPHPPGFDGRTQFRRNGRPCLVCHDEQSTAIQNSR